MGTSVQTEKIVSNNKPDIIIRDNKQRTCMSTDVAISADRNVIKKEAENILKYKDIIIEIQRMWNVKAKVIYNNRRDLKYLKITQTIPEQRIAKARIRGITETSHIRHCSQTAGSANVRIQNIFHGRNNITCNTNCKYRTVATLNTLQTRFISGT